MPNNRIFWAVKAGGLAPDGSTTFTPIHGLQTIGISTTFNLEQVFEIGQSDIYENIENVPDIEVTLEKVLDGYPLIYHLATPGATSSSLNGRSGQKSTFAMSIFGDTQDSANGTPNTQTTCSGMLVGSLGYTIPVDGNITESVTLIGNNKTWSNSAFTFTGGFNNTDSPASGVQRRDNIQFGIPGSGQIATILPHGVGGIPGINANGYNPLRSDGAAYEAHVQSISVSADLGRENLFELGRRNPYYKAASSAVEVTTDIEVISTGGDMVEATEAGLAGDGDNLFNRPIKIILDDGTVINTGTKNKLSNVVHGGGEAGGGQVTVTYSYVTYNHLTVTNPNTDPAGLS